MCPNHLPSYYAQVLLQRLCMLCCSAHVFCLSARTFGNTYGFCIQALSLLQMHPWMQKKHAKSADWRSKSQRRRGPISRAQTQEVHHETQKLVAFFGLAFALATCWGAGQIEEKSHSDLHSSPTSPSTSISMKVRMGIKSLNVKAGSLPTLSTRLTSRTGWSPCLALSLALALGLLLGTGSTRICNPM